MEGGAAHLAQLGEAGVPALCRYVCLLAVLPNGLTARGFMPFFSTSPWHGTTCSPVHASQHSGKERMNKEET